ncbi:hypothetical protein N9235_03555 [Gammaproteobacteria bacterium]|nr:hypothetical protein [Gammaproteobacteria bacterium]
MATKDTDDRPVVEQLPAGGETVNKDISRHRRKIIKASAAVVPAIMTLRSGAAAAAGSLNGCIDRDSERAAGESVDTVLGDNSNDPAHDEWARVPGKTGVKVIAQGTQDVYYGVLLTDLLFAYYDSTGSLVNNPGTLTLIENGVVEFNFYCVLKSSVWECLGDDGNPVTTTVPSTGLDAGKDVGLLVYVGKAVGGGISGSSYFPKIAIVSDATASPITASCLCSMDPDFDLIV